jgi:hypothetical protein
MQVNLHKFPSNVNAQLRPVQVGAATRQTLPLTLRRGFDRVGNPAARRWELSNLPALFNHPE